MPQLPPLLATKLHPPPVPPGLVPRPHLIERLNDGLQGSLILLSAPAGFGKTTLLSEWLRSVRSFAWLSLDEVDNDPLRFFSYFVAALQTIRGDLGEAALAMMATAPPAYEAALTVLINEVSALPGEFILVLNDYHFIESPAIHTGIDFLVEHMPPQMRLGEISYMPYLGAGALLLWTLTYGFGEEIGWRGFALPRMQKRWNALSASLILGLLWSLWHVPAFFYLENYVKMGVGIFPVFIIGVLTGSIVLTWLYNSTGGSVLLVATWHGVFDFLLASKKGEGNIAMIMSIVIIVWAVLVVVIYKPANLSRSERHAL